MDYTIAALGLLAISPVLLIAALAVKWDSCGPVLTAGVCWGGAGRVRCIQIPHDAR